MNPVTYDVFVLHQYTHNHRIALDCPFCRPPLSDAGTPWDLLESITLTPPGKRRAGGS